MKIRKIDAQPQEIKKLRVAAYCRVSTDSNDQKESLDTQKKHYESWIKMHSNWEFAGVFYDFGISGTKADARDGLQALLYECRIGRIDYILTKSISRFARNTVDSLTNIRKLKEKNIAVFFEKEGINTLEGSGELLITILSSQAQEESRNISENCHWGIVRRFEVGQVIVNHNKFLGYTKDKDGNLVVVPEEAELVRRIYRLFLEGNSSYRIKRILESEGIRTVTGNTVWQATVIDKMLTNEKYMGDALLQKTYTVDFLTKKKVVNKGIVPQYYIEDDHEAIIPKELFYRVQEEKARRGNIYRAAIKKKRGEEKSKYSGKYALSGLMICAECGQPYRRQVWSKYGKKSAVWRCDNRLKHGSERCKNSPTLKEEILHEAIMMAIGKVVEDQGEFVQAFRENVIRIIGSYGNKAKPTEYNTEIQELEKHLMSLIEESAKGNCGEEDFDREYRRVTAHLKELRKRKEQSRKEQRLAEAYDQRAGEVDDYIRKAGVLSREFDNDLVWRLIQTVKVINQNKIELQFRSGIVMVQRLDKWEN